MLNRSTSTRVNVEFLSYSRHETIYMQGDSASFPCYVGFRQSQTQQNSQLPMLTRREKEVLALVPNGLTTLEIAQKLYISETTVDSHRRNLLDKLNAKNTAALIRFAMDNKLV